MNTSHILQGNTVIYTYRNLPIRTKKKLSVSDIYTVLGQKLDYYSSLTYSQKCKIGVEKIASVIQRRIRKYNIRLSKHIIKNILKAEEDYYHSLYSSYTTD